jgi:MFS family permease
LLAAGGLGGNYVTLTWLATYLKTVRQLSVLSTGAYLGINIFGSFLGYVISAHLSDWLGRRKTFVLMACAAAVTVACYTLLPLSNSAGTAARIPTRIFPVRHHRGDGCDVRGAVSDARPRDRTGVFLQHGSRDWLIRPTSRGVAAPSLRPWSGNGHLLGIFVHPRAAGSCMAAGNAWP